MHEMDKIKTIQHPIVLIGIDPPNKKLTSSQIRFAELHQFRQQIDGGLSQPYHVHRSNALMYRTIFWAIGLLFMALMFITYFQNTNWFCGLFFSNCLMAKLSLSGICGVLALAAIAFGTYIRAEREAMGHLLRVVKRKIHTVYSHKCATLGWKRFLMYFQGCAVTAGARRAYHDAMEKVHEIQEATCNLMRHIVRSRQLDRSTRERLLNQALLEMREKLDSVVYVLDR